MRGHLRLTVSERNKTINKAAVLAMGSKLTYLDWTIYNRPVRHCAKFFTIRVTSTFATDNADFKQRGVRQGTLYLFKKDNLWRFVDFRKSKRYGRYELVTYVEWSGHGEFCFDARPESKRIYQIVGK